MFKQNKELVERNLTNSTKFILFFCNFSAKLHLYKSIKNIIQMLLRSKMTHRHLPISTARYQEILNINYSLHSNHST